MNMCICRCRAHRAARTTLVGLCVDRFVRRDCKGHIKTSRKSDSALDYCVVLASKRPRYTLQLEVNHGRRESSIGR